MIIKTPFFNDNGASYAYELIDRPGLGWTAMFDRGVLHEQDHVDLPTAIESMLVDTAQIAIQTGMDLSLNTVQDAQTLEGAVEALRRVMPPEPEPKGPEDNDAITP